MKKGICILALFSALAFGVFLIENSRTDYGTVITRNASGEGEKTEQLQVTVSGELEEETIQLDVWEKEYTPEETEEAFQTIMKKLDTVVLGKNESFDHVEHDLHLVTELDGYPMQIQWELSSYGMMNIEGALQTENLPEEGTVLEIKGHITYQDQSALYVRSVALYPITRTGKEKLLYEIKKAVQDAEESSRKEVHFELPSTVSGKTLQWKKEKEYSWHYLLILGLVLAVYVIYREREEKKKKERHRKEVLLREYPGMISKITMLLSTGTTMKNTWEKIVQNYEKQRPESSLVYEEMKITYNEMQGGILEGEAYERFGQRCALTEYVKFGALLSQNLRKGSRGLSDILRMEAIQSFENRKSNAKRKGEEAGAKLLMPMIGMLAVVLIMVMVPAFMTMNL